jgi:hypothetical protein
VRDAAPSGACRRAIGGAANVTATALRQADATVALAKKRAADMTTSGLIVAVSVGSRIAPPARGRLG